MERGVRMSVASDQIRTFRQMHSTLIRPLYMHLRAVDAPDNGYSLSCLYPGGPFDEALRRMVHARGASEIYRNNNMRAVSVSCYHFQTLDCIGIANDVVQCLWPVLFNPEQG